MLQLTRSEVFRLSKIRMSGEQKENVTKLQEANDDSMIFILKDGIIGSKQEN